MARDALKHNKKQKLTEEIQFNSEKSIKKAARRAAFFVY
jgi:hypothetical protein